MGVQKPKASKAPAPTQPAGGYHAKTVKSPTTIPVSVPEGLAATSKSHQDGHSAVHHILNPTAH